jgi:aspartate racemase
VQKLGLVGGLGPGATVHYYRELVKAQSGEMLLVHADLDRVLGAVARGDTRALADYLARLMERLANGGAEVAAISAVTPHICIRELRAMSPLPLVSIVDVINEEIRTRGFRKVALFGTRFVVQSRLFGMLEGAEVLVPEQVEEIHEAYMRAVAGSTDGRAVLSRIARELPVDAVVLAGTDLALIYDEANTNFPHIDATRSHIAAIVRGLG